MHFETFADFINMGGHGLFVWSVYAIGIGVMLFNVLRPSILQKQFFQQQSRVLQATLTPEKKSEPEVSATRPGTTPETTPETTPKTTPEITRE